MKHIILKIVTNIALLPLPHNLWFNNFHESEILNKISIVMLHFAWFFAKEPISCKFSYLHYLSYVNDKIALKMGKNRLKILSFKKILWDFIDRYLRFWSKSGQTSPQ